MCRRYMGSSLEDIEFLARSAYRPGVLRTLTDNPCDRDTLRDATGASKATIARLLNELQERNWVKRNGHQYELTDSGQFVAEEFIGLVDSVETERLLRDVWGYLPAELPGFTISLFRDANITFPEPHSPYQSIPRFTELVESARTMRAFSERSPKPGSLEAILQNAAAGMETELILPPAVINKIQRVVPDDILEQAVDSGYLTVLERERFPTNSCLELMDNHFAMYCRDEIGVTRVGIDTESTEAVTWGESVYEDIRTGARPVDLLEREVV